MSAPSTPRARDATPAVAAALIAAAREIAAHCGLLTALARAEIGAGVGAIVRLVAILGSIPLVLIAAFFLGLDGLVKIAAVALGSEQIAALLVSLPFLAAAAALGTVGVLKLGSQASRRSD